MSLLVAEALRDRRESALLALPSVRHTAELVASRCREPSWVRRVVTTLDRFQRLAGVADLETLRHDSRRDLGVAWSALQRFTAALDGLGPEQVAELAFGARLWLRTNGVLVPLRPLVDGAPAAVPAQLRPGSGPVARTALPTLVLLGSGLTAQELRTVRLGDLGGVDEQLRLAPDLRAEPMALRFREAETGREFLTFLSLAAREAVLARVRELGGPERADARAPLLRPNDLDRAAERDRALIGAGNDVNVALCRTTGDFFRTWGMPGARFDQRERRTQ